MVAARNCPPCAPPNTVPVDLASASWKSLTSRGLGTSCSSADAPVRSEQARITWDLRGTGVWRKVPVRAPDRSCRTNRTYKRRTGSQTRHYWDYMARSHYDIRTLVGALVKLFHLDGEQISMDRPSPLADGGFRDNS